MRQQTVSPRAVWLWANEPTESMAAEMKTLPFDRVVTSSQNAHVHARFALALTAPTKYVAIFDDDSIPGTHWFANCLQTMEKSPGMLGSAGVRLVEVAYRSRELFGWHHPSNDIVEVDLVGHAWFLPTEWVHYLFSAPPVVGTNGEDIELCARAWRLKGIRTYCPPHPPHDRQRWGSLRGTEYGSDAVAVSRRASHLEDRDRIVRAEVAAGWKPLFLRPRMEAASAPRSPLTLSSPAPSQQIPQSDSPALNGSGPVLSWIPQSARRILDIGCAAGSLAVALRSRQNTRLEGIAWEEESVRKTQATFDKVEQRDPDSPSFPAPSEAQDCIFCSRLEVLRDPLPLLRQAHGWLAPNGVLIARLPNNRHFGVVSSLLDGTWTPEPNGILAKDQVRFFTRREMEKLFFRAGYHVEAIYADPGPGYQDWVNRGRPREVLLGSVHITGMPADEVEEFYAAGYWFLARPAPPPDFGLTSIILITHNQLAYTQMCVQSLRLRTDEPYELILVDNGSTDGSADFLRSLPDAKVIQNPDNRGFPAAVNQGLKLATGRQILLLNNDTILTTGWLRRMLEALHTDPKIGLVGPCSNQVSGEQQVPITYEDLGELDGFAWEWGKRHASVRQDTDRLVGFCLLFRREVMDAIGLLDERFGIGCFEDDDFCLRAAQAGYRAVIARDSFVHHFGGRTFIGLGVDYAALMQKNQELFQSKWQQAPAAPPSPPAGLTSPPEVPPKFTLKVIPGKGLQLVRATALISMCMIARNNERTIGAALTSIRPYVDEIIVVDTGSTDRTIEIARSLGARVYHFPWCDSFSAARNESLKYALGQWVFWMDSDDTIDSENGRKLRALAETAPPNIMGYTVQVHCPGPPDDESASATVVDHVKLFRNFPQLRFTGRIHEQILPAIQQLGGEVEFTNVFVVHSGYDHSPEGQKRKIERDLRLLNMELEETPNHPFTLFNLGMTYTDIRQFDKAIPYIQGCLRYSTAGASHLRKAYSFLVRCYQELGRNQDAWEQCQIGLAQFPEDRELRFQQGVLLLDMGRFAEAAQAYQDLLNTPRQRYFQSMSDAIDGYLTRHNLAVAYEALGQLADAEEQLRMVVAEKPSFRTGWRGLAKLLCRRGQQAEVLRLAEGLQRKPATTTIAALMKYELALTQGQWDQARRELQEAILQRPKDVELLNALCQLLFEHGMPAETEKVLQQLLQVCPEDAAAYHNLGAVLMNQRKSHEAVVAYQKSVEFRPQAPVTWGELGHALWAANRAQEAINAWNETLRLDPTNAVARSALARVQG